MELTNCGAVTIKGKVYYHSNVNPHMEGRQFANAYSDGTSFDYTVYGLGFMYHIYELIKKDERYAVTGIESDIRMIYMITASKEAVRKFKGKRYVAYQVGYDKSEEWANISGAKLFESGGSVSTFVVDFALRLGCRRLITTGLDLGFPKNKTHAFGLSQDIKSDEYGEYVECVSGGRMETSKVFNAYRVWIEKRVADTPAELINLTEGAVIKGMKNVVNL